ncbi:uncharacterized protein ACBR49_011153 [Aulostomus maculatus]
MCNKMSDVRLSNASPTVERVDARQPDNVRPPVSRNLFGTPDREEIRRYLTASIEADVQTFVEIYNFDPVHDRPLSPVHYDWQEDADAPEFYRRPPHGSQRPRPDAGGSRDSTVGEERPSGRLQSRDGPRKRPAEASGPCSSECPLKKSHSDEDDDDEQPRGARDQAVTAADEPRKTENRAEV